MMCGASGALALLLALAAPAQREPAVDTLAPAVRALVASAPDTVTVGDRFRSLVRLEVPPGTRVLFPPLEPDDSLQLVGPVRVDTLAADTLVAVYPLAAWIAGEPLRAIIDVELELAGGTRYRHAVPLRLPVVRPVLPASGDVQPRPPRGLLLREPAGVTRWWTWGALALLALLLAALALYLSRRPRRVEPREPRVEALRALDAIARSHAARLSADLFYSDVTRVLRRYLAALDLRWSEDLTSSELIGRMRSTASGVDPVALEELLRAAEPVKYGAASPAPGTPQRFWAEVRGWIERNPPVDPARREAA
jgi:hypothetical protein